jgi:hypothetical protein
LHFVAELAKWIQILGGDNSLSLELAGENFSEGGCCGQPKRGRPSAITAEKLRRNVIELQFALEQNWGEVGWLLSQAKAISDVQLAFKKIVNPQCSFLEPFTDERTRETSPTENRKLRKRVAESTQRHRQHLADRQTAQDACEHAFYAWAADSDPVSRAQIQAILPALSLANSKKRKCSKKRAG